MSFFPKPPVYTGLDTSSQFTRAAYMRKTRKGWEVVSLKTFEEGEDVNLLDRAATVAALPSRETLVRTCELKIKKERDIHAALGFQLEPMLPYPAEKAIVQAQSVEKRGEGTVLTAFAVRKDHLEARLEQLNERGIEPEMATCVPYALAALTTLFPQTAYPQFLVHEGEEEVTCVLVERGKLLAARAFDRKRELGTEIRKTLLSFSTTHKTKEFETILLLGNETEKIQKATGKTVLFPATSTLPITQEELIRYGLAIGIALAAEGPDFRQKEFAYPHPWRKAKKPLLVSGALALLLAGTLFTFGQLALKEQRRVVGDAFISLMQVEGKQVDEAALPATSYDYLRALSQLENEVKARPDTQPLHPGVPKAREVLVWLSNYQTIEVESLHYSMVKRPDFTRKGERYKVRVELEFSAKDVNAANTFHEALNSTNKFVDANEEIQWSAGRGKYRTTFYLKDKTRYS